MRPGGRAAEEKIMRSRSVRAMLLCALTFAGSCRTPGSVRPMRADSGGIGCAARCSEPPDDLITITYLGVSGLLIQRGGHVMLTAPFFSDLSFGKVRPRMTRLLRRNNPIAADTAAIDALFPRAGRSASVILVGHGHYDHLMDIPLIANRYATAAVVYGSPTVRHMLMGDPELRSNPRRIITIDTISAGTATREGKWFYSGDSAFRFMALEASHAPAFKLGQVEYRFASGTVASDLDSLPRTAADWKLGEPYAFII